MDQRTQIDSPRTVDYQVQPKMFFKFLFPISSYPNFYTRSRCFPSSSGKIPATAQSASNPSSFSTPSWPSISSYPRARRVFRARPRKN